MRQVHSIRNWTIVLVSSKSLDESFLINIGNAFISPCRADVLDKIVICKYFAGIFGGLKDVNLNYNKLLATVNKSPVYSVRDLKFSRCK